MEQKNANYGLGMTVIGSIFFIFGFATTFIITLSGQVKDIFELTEFKAQLLSFSFFITYFFISIPIGLYIKKIGYKSALITGLLLMAAGSFLFFPAAKAPSFPLFLAATFVLASGVVFLQTAANPYVAALGSEESAGGRMNLVQALNSIATMVAPWVIATFIFRGASEMLTSMQKAETVQMPFIIIGVIVVLVAVAIFLTKLPEVGGSAVVLKKSVWKHPHVVLGALGIFFYVGAEVGTGGLILNYLKETQFIDGLPMESAVAGKYVAIYWGGAMVGRFFGSIMLSNITDNVKKYSYAAAVLLLALVSGSFVTEWNWNIGLIFMIVAVGNFLLMQLGKGNAGRSLAVFALLAATLALVTAFTSGSIALWAVVSIGMFNSIMFPNIFTLAVKDLEPGELSTASGIINTLIFGGAIIPLIMGKIADVSGYSWAFVVPAICYLYIFFYAVKGSKFRSA
jgi:FHS family L-fucose permease-like MFS transporter